MSSRQKGKHRARHHAHAVKPTSMPCDWKLPPLVEVKADVVEAPAKPVAKAKAARASKAEAVAA